MDEEIALHNIAMCATKGFVDTNNPDYIKNGYASLVADLTTRYIEAYKMAQKELKKHMD